MQDEREEQIQATMSYIDDDVGLNDFHGAFPSELLSKSFDLDRASSQIGAATSGITAKPSVDPTIHEEHERMWRAMMSDDDDDITDYIVSITASAEHYEYNNPTMWLRNFVSDLVEGHPRWCCGTYVYMDAD
ncbi:hypothetical protein FisN_11Hh172 [Fistulifera solaris]|jgi:hypothetical protein|uniref:Uncharacterized protein n=1 Tax=Fistulifera solaris TaxID=1519565 RepID=A0A1Z5JKT1_FISSO|nr:hypothetical protein FisN_11Hh172 [Fistulifera solaris]|eukprot:GAX14371.1 hypothetical protein FisN_11Hh172 [Fistulifera solaris]